MGVIKLFLFFLGVARKDVYRFVEYNGKVFVIDIHRFVPANEELEKWKKDLGFPRSND